MRLEARGAEPLRSPECRQRYRDPTCPVQGFHLNRSLPAHDMTQQHRGFQLSGYEMDHHRKVAVLENEIEAGLLRSILEQRGIPHTIRSYYDTAYDGLFQTQKGWGHVSAPPSRHREILEILLDLRKEATRRGGSSP